MEGFKDQTRKAQEKALRKCRDDIGCMKNIIGEEGFGWAYKFASSRLKDDEEMVRYVVAIHGESIRYASSRWRDNEEIVRIAITSSPHAYQHASSRLRNHKEITLLALDEYGQNWAHTSKYLKKDEDVVKAAIQTYPQILPKLHKTFRNDKSIVLHAIRFGLPFIFIPRQYRSDIEIAKTFVKNSDPEDIPAFIRVNKEMMLYFIGEHPKYYHSASHSLQNDEEIAIAAVNAMSADFYLKLTYPMRRNTNVAVATIRRMRLSMAEEFFPNFANDTEVIHAFLKRDFSVLNYVARDILEDREIVLRSISLNPEHYKFVRPSFKKEPSFIQECVNNHICPPFEDVPIELQDCKAFLLKYLALQPKAIACISTPLRLDPDILDIIIKNKDRFDFTVKFDESFPKDLYSCHTIAFLAVKKEPKELKYMPKEIQSDPEIYLTALQSKKNLDALPFVPENANKDKITPILIQKIKNWQHISTPSVPPCFMTLDVQTALIDRFTWVAYPDLLLDRDLALYTICKDPTALAAISSELKADKEFVLSCILKCRTINLIESIYPLLIPELKEDMDIVLMCVRKHPGLIQKSLTNFLFIKEVALLAVRSSGRAYLLLSDAFKQDEEILFVMLVTEGFKVLKNPDDLCYLEPYFDDKEIMMKAIISCCIVHASVRLRDDMDLAKIALMVGRNNFSHLSSRLQGHPDILRHMVQVHPMSLDTIKKAKNPEITDLYLDTFLSAYTDCFKPGTNFSKIKQLLLARSYAEVQRNLNHESGIIFTAMLGRNSTLNRYDLYPFKNRLACAYYQLPNELQESKEMTKIAVQCNFSNLKYIGKLLLQDTIFMNELIQETEHNIYLAMPKHAKRAVALAAFRKFPENLPFIDYDLIPAILREKNQSRLKRASHNS